jgi:uncharacterized membrane-anchored protein
MVHQKSHWPSRKTIVAGLAAAAWLSVAAAAEPGPQPQAPAAPRLPELHYQTGAVELPNKVATLKLDAEYRYLDPNETRKLLIAWGNPPEAADDTQGAVVPADVDPFDDGAWAVVLTYLNEGHVDDKDAAGINYTDLMKEMKSNTEAANEAREKAGYGRVNLLGWASEPRYDSTAHKLYWAKELDFGGQERTLNYDVRVLGREGVLSMNAVASMGQLRDVQQGMQSLLKLSEFNAGHRYEEFNSDTDRMAAYGIGALVAGGVAAKLGLFAKLLGVLVAFKKLIIVGVIAVGGFVARLFKGRSKDQPA